MEPVCTVFAKISKDPAVSAEKYFGPKMTENKFKNVFLM